MSWTRQWPQKNPTRIQIVGCLIRKFVPVVGYGLGIGVLVQPVSNAITIAAWHLDAFYFRRRLFMRSAKLLGSAGLTSVYGALSSPDAS